MLQIKKSFYNKFNALLSLRDRRLLVVLLFMSLFLSIIETIGIAAVMPFISVASNPELINTNKYYKIAYEFFSFDSSKEFIIYFGLLLIVFYFFRGIYTVFYNYYLNAFSLKKYYDFSNKLYNNYINFKYIEFINRNSATMSKMIVTEAAQLSVLVQNVLIFMSELIIIIILYVLLLFVNVKMTLLLTLFLSIKIFFLSKTVSRLVKKKGVEREIVQDKLYRIINETFGNFKVIKFISNQKKMYKKFSDITKDFSAIHTINNTLTVIPRSILEAFGLSLIVASLIYVIMFSSNASGVIPTITMYALALYRILPAVTKIINSYNSIIFNIASLDVVYNDFLFQNTKELDEAIEFNDSIVLNDISFAYDPAHKVINQLSLEIKKGSKIAFTGKSGSGKSTLVDIICGIYEPNNGEILIDNVKLDNRNIKSWRKKIGYIPQSIYLFDSTIADNITFGREYDEVRLVKVLKQANIYEYIMEKDGFNTMVGEGGIQLSGGQKQRIGIARALYGDPEILVLDEATSALDTKTEAAIMDEIYEVSDNKTLIIIAHRLSTVDQCDIKIEVGND